MKKLGILGGTTWHSSIDYYRLLNSGVQERLGGVASADLILRSVDFALFREYQAVDDWDSILSAYVKDAQAMMLMGADGIAIAANTMHMIADDLQSQIDIPLLHVADAIKSSAADIESQSLGVLGTEFTMGRPFYREALAERALQVLVPNEVQQMKVSQVIYDELVTGTIVTRSQNYYLDLVTELHQRGADAVVLGCTEIGLLVKKEMTSVPLIDSLTSHTDFLLKWILSD